MRKLIILVICFFSQTAFASWTSLTCVDPNNNFTLAIDFDEGKQLVKASTQTLKAFIDKNEIKFSQMLGNVNYLHIINRTNGILLISGNEQNSFMTYQCKLSSPKF